MHSHLKCSLSVEGLKASTMTLISSTPFLWHTAALKVFVSHPTDLLYTGECFGDDVGDT